MAKKVTDAPDISESIILDKPIVRGELTIESIQIRNPDTDDLLDVDLQDLAVLQAATVKRLLPSITVPPVTIEEAGKIKAANLMDIGEILTGFLTSQHRRMPSQKG